MYGQVEVDCGRMVRELVKRPTNECGGQEAVVHAGSWSHHN